MVAINQSLKLCYFSDIASDIYCKGLVMFIQWEEWFFFFSGISHKVAINVIVPSESKLTVATCN